MITVDKAKLTRSINYAKSSPARGWMLTTLLSKVSGRSNLREPVAGSVISNRNFQNKTVSEMSDTADNANDKGLLEVTVLSSGLNSYSGLVIRNISLMLERGS